MTDTDTTTTEATRSVCFSIDRLVVLPLDPDMTEGDAIRYARMQAADMFGQMMDNYDEDDSETIIVLEMYDNGDDNLEDPDTDDGEE